MTTRASACRRPGEHGYPGPVLLIALLACSAQAPPPDPPPDLLVVVLDTVRADHLRLYGHTRDTSYQLEALAEGGLVFDDVTVSSTWTWPGHAELFTGRPPWEHGAHYVPGVSPFAELRPELPTLPEQLETRGYGTSCVSSNVLLAADMGLTRGFDTVLIGENDQDTVEKLGAHLQGLDDRPQLVLVNLLSAHAPWFVKKEVPWSEQHRATVEAAEGPLGAMRTVKKGEMGLHPDNDCAPDLRCDIAYAAERFSLQQSELALIEDLYDGGLVSVDNALRAVIEAWLQAGRSGVVVVTSDHGEFLGEHHMLQHRFVTRPEVLHIPLLMVGKGIPKGVRVKEPVQLKHLHSTLLALAGVEAPGWTLLDAARGVPHQEPITAMAWPSDAYRDHAERLSSRWVWYREGEEAVAVHGDHVEPVHLGGGEVSPARASTLAAAARALPSDLDPRPSAAGGEAQLEALRALGYIDD